MGTNHSCMICKTTDNNVDNPLLEIHTYGKRDGQFICLSCLMKKLKKREEYKKKLTEKLTEKYVSEFAEQLER